MVFISAISPAPRPASKPLTSSGWGGTSWPFFPPSLLDPSDTPIWAIFFAASSAILWQNRTPSTGRLQSALNTTKRLILLVASPVQVLLNIQLTFQWLHLHTISNSRSYFYLYLRPPCMQFYNAVVQYSPPIDKFRDYRSSDMMSDGQSLVQHVGKFLISLN